MWTNGGYQELLHYLASVIPARFSCNVSHNKNTLQVESVLTYTRNKSLFFEKYKQLTFCNLNTRRGGDNKRNIVARIVARMFSVLFGL